MPGERLQHTKEPQRPAPPQISPCSSSLSCVPANMSHCSINPLPLVLSIEGRPASQGLSAWGVGLLQCSQYIECRAVFVAHHVQLPAVSCCTLPHSRGPCQIAIGSLTQRAADFLDSHDSLSSSTDSNSSPSGSGRNAGSTALTDGSPPVMHTH